MTSTSLLPRTHRALLMLVVVFALLAALAPASFAGKKGGSKGSHGAAMTVAAQCPLPDDAHTVLVKSVARDLSVTVSEAQDACEQALLGVSVGG